MTQVRRFAPLLFVLGLSGVAAAPSAQTDFSGIVSYVYEANPQGIKPKMYNWEIRLSTADSRNGVYEIVQINKRLQPGATAVDTTPNVIVDSKLVAVGPDGSIAFALYVGDKVPKENMGRRGNWASRSFLRDMERAAVLRAGSFSQARRSSAPRRPSRRLR